MNRAAAAASASEGRCQRVVPEGHCHVSSRIPRRHRWWRHRRTLPRARTAQGRHQRRGLRARSGARRAAARLSHPHRPARQPRAAPLPAVRAVGQFPRDPRQRRRTVPLSYRADGRTAGVSGALRRRSDRVSPFRQPHPLAPGPTVRVARYRAFRQRIRPLRRAPGRTDASSCISPMRQPLCAICWLAPTAATRASASGFYHRRDGSKPASSASPAS